MDRSRGYDFLDKELFRVANADDGASRRPRSDAEIGMGSRDSGRLTPINRQDPEDSDDWNRSPAILLERRSGTPKPEHSCIQELRPRKRVLRMSRVARAEHIGEEKGPSPKSSCTRKGSHGEQASFPKCPSVSEDKAKRLLTGKPGLVLSGDDEDDDENPPPAIKKEPGDGGDAVVMRGREPSDPTGAHRIQAMNTLRLQTEETHIRSKELEIEERKMDIQEQNSHIQRQRLGIQRNKVNIQRQLLRLDSESGVKLRQFKQVLQGQEERRWRALGLLARSLRA